MELSRLNFFNFDNEKALYYLDKTKYDINNFRYFNTNFNIKIRENDYEGALALFSGLDVSFPHYIYVIYLEIKFNNFDKAYKHLLNLIKNNSNDVYEAEIKKIERFLSNKLNIPSLYNYESYGVKQILNYSKEDCLKHLDCHKYENEEKKVHSVFLGSTDINDLYHSVSNKLVHSKPYKSSFTDKYLLDMKCLIGKVSDIKTSKVEIVTTNNSKDILTIYPCLSHYTLLYTKKY